MKHSKISQRDFLKLVNTIEDVYSCKVKYFTEFPNVRHIRVCFILKLSEYPKITYKVIHIFPYILNKENIKFIEIGWLRLKALVKRVYNYFCNYAKENNITISQKNFDLCCKDLGMI